MDPSTSRGLAFLLSLGALPIACTPDPKDSTDGGTGGTGGTSDATDGQGTTGAPTTSDGATTTGGSASTGSTTGDPTDTGAAGEPCEIWADFQIGCDPMQAGDEAELVMYCSLEQKRRLTIYGPDCGALWDAFLECHATASCDDPNPCDDAFYTAVSCVPDPGPLCMAYGAKMIECIPEEANYNPGGRCQVYLGYGAYSSGPACVAALEEHYACLTALSCAELMMEGNCDPESTKVGELCMLGDDGAPARPATPLRSR